MIRFIIAITAGLLLSGCMFQTVNSFDLHRAVHYCKSLDNVASILVFWDGDEKVVCMDSSHSMLVNVKGASKE